MILSKGRKNSSQWISISLTLWAIDLSMRIKKLRYWRRNSRISWPHSVLHKAKTLTEDFRTEASILEQRLSNVLDLLMDEEAGFAMTADEAAECDDVLTKCYLSKNDIIGDFNIISGITI